MKFDEIRFDEPIEHDDVSARAAVRGCPELEFNWRLTPPARYFCNYISHSTALRATQRAPNKRDNVLSVVGTGSILG